MVSNPYKSNIKELNKAHKEFMRLSTEDIAKALEKVGYFFFSRLQTGTPKDTGRARNGWIPIVDTSSPSEWKPVSGKKAYGLNDFPFGQIKFNSVIWISNNVEYILPLENGHSMQAPYGFINGALQNTTLYIESQISKLNRKRYNV